MSAPPHAPQDPPFLGIVLAQDSAEVAAESEGQLEGVYVRVGDRVARGARLASVDPRPIRDQLAIARAARAAAQAEVRKAAVEVTDSKRRYERRRALSDLLSKEELAASEADTETAAATLAASEAHAEEAKARVRDLEAALGRSEIRAPFEGIVAFRYLDSGSRVTAGTPVVRLISSRELVIRFAVPPQKAFLLRLGARVHARVEPSGDTISGVISHIAPEIDAPSHMFFAEAQVEEPLALGGRLQPGMVARVAVDERR